VHKPSLVDIGRELDGAEGPHAIEGEPSTELADGLDPQPEEFLIRKRRYSAFFGTELDLVLRSYGTRTVLLVGGLTDVCIHYTAVDAHQHDYFVRVATDAVTGDRGEGHIEALLDPQESGLWGVIVTFTAGTATGIHAPGVYLFGHGSCEAGT